MAKISTGMTSTIDSDVVGADGGALRHMAIDAFCFDEGFIDAGMLWQGVVAGLAALGENREGSTFRFMGIVTGAADEGRAFQVAAAGGQ